MNTAALDIKVFILIAAIIAIAVMLSSGTGIGPWADQLAVNSFFTEHESTMRQISKTGAVDYATGG